MMVESTDNAARSQWGDILTFKLNLTQDQSTQNNKDLKQSVCTSGPNLAVRAWMAHMFSRRQARNECTDAQTDTRTEVGNAKLASGKMLENIKFPTTQLHPNLASYLQYLTLLSQWGPSSHSRHQTSASQAALIDYYWLVIRPSTHVRRPTIWLLRYR